MNYKYTCLNPIADCGLDNLTENYTRTENLAEAEAVFVRSAKMEALPEGAKVLAVARAGAGVNNIPHADYAKDGVVVFNTPGANANGVKELVIAAMLLASRDIVGGIDWVKANVEDPAINKSAEKAKKAFAGTEIQGKKLGVIGLGAIGQKVANAAVQLGMEVFGYDPYLSVDAAWNLDHSVKHCKNVEAIYGACDFITLHVPALDSTKGMINAETIAMMKRGVIVINAARDALVNEKDMLAALESGKVRRYVTDFPNSTTAGQKGCIVIPHLGASTEEAEDNCAVMAVKEIRDYLEQQGMDKTAVDASLKNMGEEPRKQAEERARMFIFLLALARREKIEVSAQEVDMQIAQMAKQYKQDFQQMRNAMYQNGAVNDIQDRMLTSKALALMLDKAQKTAPEAKAE